MAIDAVCPECDATYTLPNEQKGKKVRCKKCQAVFLVTSKADGKTSSKTGIKRRDDDDDRSRYSSERSRSRRSPAPPTRSSAPRRRAEVDDEDEDEEDRPEGKSKAPLIIAAVVGVLILVGGGIGLVFALKDDKKEPSASPTAQAPNPPANPPVQPVGGPGNPLFNPQGGNPLGGKVVNPPTNPPANPPVTNPPANPPSNPPTNPPINPPVNPPDKPPVNPPTNPPDKTPSDPPKNRERKDRLTPEEIKALKRATVFIKVTESDGSRASGSGFFGSADAAHIVLTNAHVVGMLSADSRPPRQVTVIINSGQEDQRELPAKLLGVDRSSDLAVLDVGSTTTGLPKALTVRTASDLNELDNLYVAGFPLGERLGKEITIRPSSVSSLRKKNGALDLVQVNGGMDPGNSGGPVVNGNGEVVGVAVSGIPGKMINFAIPGERVHTILNGRLSAMGIGLPFIENGKFGLPVVMDMIDPRERINEVALDVWTGDPPQGGRRNRPPADSTPAVAAGDSAHEHIKLPYTRGKAEAEITIPDLPPGKVYWIQPNWKHTDGKTRWASAQVYKFPSPAVERKPATLALRFTPGVVRTVTLKSTLTVKLGQDDDEATFGHRTMAQLSEQVSQVNNLGTWVKMQYQKVSQDDIVDKKVRPDPDLKPLLPFIPALSALLQYDGVGKLAQNTIQVNRARIRSVALLKALQDFHEPIKQGLEAMSIPLPNSEVQPRATWQSPGRPLPIPGRKKRTGTIDMTYTYLGRRVRDGREEAVLKIEGTMNSPDKKFGGKATGTALYDMTSGYITKANVSVTMDMDVQLKESERSIRVVATVQVGLDRK